MAAGVSTKLWAISNIAKLVEDAEAPAAGEMERVLFEDGFGPAKPFEHSRYVRLDRTTGFLLAEGFAAIWEANDNKLNAGRRQLWPYRPLIFKLTHYRAN
jgi:hypothetical protein